MQKICYPKKAIKGQSLEINVRFFGAFWIEKILLLFPRKGLVNVINVFMLYFEVKLSQPVLLYCTVLYCTFGLYFAYEEYHTDDSNSPADWYHTSEMFQRYSTVR